MKKPNDGPSVGRQILLWLAIGPSMILVLIGTILLSTASDLLYQLLSPLQPFGRGEGEDFSFFPFLISGGGAYVMVYVAHGIAPHFKKPVALLAAFLIAAISVASIIKNFGGIGGWIDVAYAIGAGVGGFHVARRHPAFGDTNPSKQPHSG